MISTRILITATIIFRLLTPVSAADREHEQLLADIRILKEQASQLQIVMSELSKALVLLSAKVDTGQNDARKASADHRLALENLSGGVRILREKIDETNVRVSSLSHEVESLRTTIPTMTSRMTQLAVDPETGLPTESLALLAVDPIIGNISPQRMYDTAWADYTNGQWVLAHQGFEAYIKTFPSSPQTDDAAFYIGQTFFAEGKFREAVQAFESVLENYPDGDVVPEASYKRGLALDQLGESQRARQAFELLVRNFPESSMAALAQQALDRLNQGQR